VRDGVKNAFQRLVDWATMSENVIAADFNELFGRIEPVLISFLADEVTNTLRNSGTTYAQFVLLLVIYIAWIFVSDEGGAILLWLMLGVSSDSDQSADINEHYRYGMQRFQTLVFRFKDFITMMLTYVVMQYTIVEVSLRWRQSQYDIWDIVMYVYFVGLVMYVAIVNASALTIPPTQYRGKWASWPPQNVQSKFISMAKPVMSAAFVTQMRKAYQ